MITIAMNSVFSLSSLYFFPEKLFYLDLTFSCVVSSGPIPSRRVDQRPTGRKLANQPTTRQINQSTDEPTTQLNLNHITPRQTGDNVLYCTVLYCIVLHCTVLYLDYGAPRQPSPVATRNLSPARAVETLQRPSRQTIPDRPFSAASVTSSGGAARERTLFRGGGGGG